MSEKQDMNARINHWFEKPYKPGGALTATLLILAMAICAMWVKAGMDNDSYYMIAQGRDILANGIPKENNFTFADDKIVVQQWLYCILIALADQIPNNIGLMLFMLVQAVCLAAMINAYAGKYLKDPFWTWLATALALLLSPVTYIASLRPENITLILMLCQMTALEQYRQTKRKAWLAALPAVMIAEANLHISMWPIHVCVYLAYLFPHLAYKISKKLAGKNKTKIDYLKEYLFDNGLRPDPWLYGSVILSILAVFLNPYGLDGVMYLFRSMPVFSIVAISEQEGIYLLSRDALISIGVLFTIMTLAVKKKIWAAEFLMIAGLTALSLTNYHNTMYMPVALAVLARVLLRTLSEKKPAKASEIMPNGVKAALYACLAGTILMTIAYTAPKTLIFTDKHGMDPVIEYLVENAGPDDRILNNMNMGPMLEYHGMKNLHSDTRPELLLPAITGCEENFARLIPWLGKHVTSKDIEERYNGDVGEYLDKNDIQFVTDTTQNPVLPYLTGWLDNSDQWERVELEIPDEIKTADKKVYAVWRRVD